MLTKTPSDRAHAKLRAQQLNTCSICPRPCFNGPERLVGIGFRCWLAGYQTGDIACWEQAWDVFAGELGASRAKIAITELSCWTRAISQSALRPIEVFPRPCANFCRDECIAVSMVAASQHNACSALQTCAFALLENAEVDDVTEGAANFANALRSIDVVLSPVVILNAMTAAQGPVF